MSEESWKKVQSSLKEYLTKPEYETWIRPTQFSGFKNGELALIAANSFSSDWLRNKYSQIIQETAREIFGEPVTLKIKAKVKKTLDPMKEKKHRDAYQQWLDSLRGSMILSDPPGVFESKEKREKRRQAEKIKAKKLREKVLLYLFLALIIIGAILVISRG